MRRNRQEWTDAVGAALRDAEAAPPADGWERLAGALARADRAAVAGEAVPGAVRGVAAPPRWRILVRRAAAVAALLAVAAGGYLWRAADSLPTDGWAATDPIVASVAPDVAGGTGGDALPAGPERGAAEAEVEPLAQLVAAAVGDRGAGAAGNTPELATTGRQPLRERAGADGRSAKALTDRADYASRGAEASAGDGLQTGAAEGVDARSAAEAAAEAAADGREETASAGAETASRSDAPRAERASERRATARPTDAGRAPERRSSLAVHAGGVPGASGGGRGTGEYVNAAPEASATLPFAHAPGDVMSHVVRGMDSRPPRPAEYRHRQPVSVGLAVRWGFSRGLSLATGANYTLLRSEARPEGRSGWVDQRLHFVGIPLRLDWQYLERGRLSLYIGAGGQVEKCVAARLDGQRIEERGVQWSLAAAAGVQCGLGGVVALYAEPEVSWYVNDTWLRTSRTDHPLSFTLRLGVRFSF